MPRPASLASDRPTEEAARLGAYLTAKDSVDLAHPDADLIDMLRNLDGLALIGTAEAIGDKPGSPALIRLYEMWIELHAGDADAVFTVWYKLGLQYGARGDTENQVAAYRSALAVKPDLMMRP